MISLIQTAEGALNESHEILQRMRELTVQASNTGTQESDDLEAIQSEIDSLIEELGGEEGSQGIADRTQFNGKDLLTGDFDGSEDGESLTFQIGANQEQQLTVDINDMRAGALGVNDIKVVEENEGEEGTRALDSGAYDEALGDIDTAIKSVSSTRSELGAVQNRLDHTINNLGASSENLTAAESRIRDTDMAKEMMDFTKNNILTQSSQAMLAQANQVPQGVLQLLQ